MELKDFSYFLPDELIAQHPSEQRDHSRMLVLGKNKESIENHHFFQLPDFLRQGDVLVINDSRVIPARLFGKKPTGAILEILLLTRKENRDKSQIWEVLARPAKRLHENDVIDMGHDCEAKALARISDKKWLFEFSAMNGFDHYLNQYGRAPLPPYIKRKKTITPDITDDRERYQTIYAQNLGSIAAPTAGLHFSADVIKTLQAKGVEVAAVTLHVGYGTFLPIEVKEAENHVMESEHVRNQQRRSGKD